MPRLDAVVPVPSPVLTAAPFFQNASTNGPAATIASRVSRVQAMRPSLVTPDADSDEDDESARADSSPTPRWTIAFGALAAVLLVLTLIFWTKVGARDTTIRQNENRMAQMRAGTAGVQAKLDEAIQIQAEQATIAALKHQDAVAAAQAQTTAVQTQLKSARTDLTEARAQLATAQAVAAGLQGRLEKSTAEIAQLQRPAAGK